MDGLDELRMRMQQDLERFSPRLRHLADLERAPALDPRRRPIRLGQLEAFAGAEDALSPNLICRVSSSQKHVRGPSIGRCRPKPIARMDRAFCGDRSSPVQSFVNSSVIRSGSPSAAGTPVRP